MFFEFCPFANTMPVVGLTKQTRPFNECFVNRVISIDENDVYGHAFDIDYVAEILSKPW